jgi:hypothetical protein
VDATWQELEPEHHASATEPPLELSMPREFENVARGTITTSSTTDWRRWQTYLAPSNARGELLAATLCNFATGINVCFTCGAIHRSQHTADESLH